MHTLIILQKSDELCNAAETDNDAKVTELIQSGVYVDSTNIVS